MKRWATLTGCAGAAALVLTDPGGPALTLLRLTITGATIGAAAATDVAEHRIPNRLVIPAMLACLALTINTGLSAAAITGVGAVAILLAVSLIVPSALGMGDIKLALVIVLGLNQHALDALVLGLLCAGAAASLVLLRHGRQAGKRSLPLAPFLAAGSLLALL